MVKVITERKNLKELIGKRIEIPVHYDLWMRGARFGVVTSFIPGKNGISDCVCVKMDHPEVKKRVKVWKHDVEYCRLV